MVDIRTNPIIHDFVRICFHGNECIYEKERYKTVMGHKKHNDQKWNITRSPEFQIGDKSENGEQ